MKANVIRAIDQDAYDFLMGSRPDYIVEIAKDLAAGMTPEEIRRVVAAEVGPERAGLAKRCEQAARHLLRARQAE